MVKAVGLAFIGGLLVGLFLGLFLMSCLIAGKDNQSEYNDR